MRKLAASAGAGADNAEGGLVTMWNTMLGMSTRTMPAMFGDGELVSVIEGNLLGRSRGLKRVENGSNMSSLKFIFLPNVCGLWQDGGVFKPGGRQELIPSSSDCFPMARIRSGSNLIRRRPSWKRMSIRGSRRMIRAENGSVDDDQLRSSTSRISRNNWPLMVILSGAAAATGQETNR